MAVVYLKSDTGRIVAIDATQKVTKSRRNSITKSSVMSGAQASDGYTVGNPTVTFSGVCSTTKLAINRTGSIEATQYPTPTELHDLMEEMILSEQRFTLYGNNLIPTLEDVVITSYDIIQEKWIDSVEVLITVEQVFVTKQAQETVISVPNKASEDEISYESDKGTGSATEKTSDRRNEILKLYYSRYDLSRYL
jgi:hypothetical protein